MTKRSHALGATRSDTTDAVFDMWVLPIVLGGLAGAAMGKGETKRIQQGAATGGVVALGLTLYALFRYGKGA